MPIVEAHILQGYTSEEKNRLMSALTEAVRFVVPAPDEAITVMLHEYPQDAYARGGNTRTPAPARSDCKKIVTDFLAALEARKLEKASSALGEGFKMQFPGAPPMEKLSELVNWAKNRYRFVKKSIADVGAFQSGQTTIVFVHGTLSGEWPDGTNFSGIRFIDRFEIEDGLIIRQDVWNDIAEMRPA